MEYMTVKEAAEKWGISLRSAQTYCINGKIEGATKFGGTWAIPIDAAKPSDIRKKTKSTQSKPQTEHNLSGISIPMPLLNTPFEFGNALSAAEGIENPDLRSIALAEYYYFSGDAAKAAQKSEKYLGSEDLGLRLSACWIYAYASLALNKIIHA